MENNPPRRHSPAAAIHAPAAASAFPSWHSMNPHRPSSNGCGALSSPLTGTPSRPVAYTRPARPRDSAGIISWVSTRSRTEHAPCSPRPLEAPRVHGRHPRRGPCFAQSVLEAFVGLLEHRSSRPLFNASITGGLSSSSPRLAGVRMSRAPGLAVQPSLSRTRAARPQDQSYDVLHQCPGIISVGPGPPPNTSPVLSGPFQG